MGENQQSNNILHNMENASCNEEQRDKVKPVMKPPRTDKFSYEDSDVSREATVEDILLYLQSFDDK